MRFEVAATAVAFLLGASCAHVEAPPGGPEDRTPPALLVTRPDTLAVVPEWDAPAVLVFNERVSERGVEDAVMVSPRTSTVVVDHSSDEIRVRLRGGWQPGTIYQVTVLPGVQDLFGNPVTEPAMLVFSTGPEIPDTEVTGVVRDPITGNPEEGVRVEAIRTADSLVYAVPSDTAGGYRLRRIPEGAYDLRAFRDLNRNRALDAFEPRAVSAVTVAAGDSVRQTLGILMPDSTAPVLASAELRDSATVELTFDDYLDPTQRMPPAAVQIRSPQGAFVPVSSVTVGEPVEPEEEAEGQEAAADTATAEPLPSQSIFVALGSSADIEPGVEYSVRVRSVRNLLGLESEAETTLVVPVEEGDTPAPAPADSVAPADPVAPTDSVIPADTVAPTDTLASPDTARAGAR